MAVEERWPELARIKERFQEKPTALEMVMRLAEQVLGGLGRAAAAAYVPPLAPTGNTAGMTFNMLSGPTNSLVPDPYGQVSVEDKELMEKLLAELGPDIQRQSEELIKTEIRDSMMLGGNWVRLKELLKSGAKPKVVRKRQGGRDPLFLQFGDGVTTEIEEVRVLG